MKAYDCGSSVVAASFDAQNDNISIAFWSTVVNGGEAAGRVFMGKMNSAERCEE